MAEEIDRPLSWIVNFVGPEGFRENFRVEAADHVALAERRDHVLALLTTLGAVPDVRKLFDDNGTKPGKLASTESKPSKLTKYADTTKTEADADPMLRAAQDSIAAPAAAEGMTYEKPSAIPAGSKLAKFIPKAAAAPTPAPVTASAPNVSPKLSRFVAKEKKGE
jgi:hypothetical protein